MPSGCAWGPDGRLAVSYTADLHSQADGSTFQRSLVTMREPPDYADQASEDLPLLSPGDRLVGWIPTGEGMLVHSVPACEPTPCSDFFVSGVYTPDGYQAFSLAGGTVLALIPAP